ncbi:MAG: hypothetical protein AAGK00_07320 [Pseudomonadota bacterium]
MSDDKDKKAAGEDKDVVAQVDPQDLTDDQLEGADGGWSWGMSQKQNLKFSTVNIPGGDQFNKNINADTIYAGSKDDLVKGPEAFLRTRPGRFGNI